MKILICYDGSTDAKAAVNVVCHLFDGGTAVVCTVWEGLSEVAARACAEEGTGHARAAGMPASALAVPCGESISETILDQAAEVGADLIVLGSRGLSDAKAAAVGSVSRAVLHDADRPALVVPTPEVARKRSGGRRRPPAPADREFFSARL
jgi:nucleotide-binding universal stress UspA family protein